MPVYSPVKGHVIRLKASYTGMGKALYIQDDSGTTYVFAHLSKFIHPLDSILRERQCREKKYIQDIWIDDPLPVDSGQVVAFTGKTGTGPPHLHFEIRKGFFWALNPLAYMEVPDTIPPEIKEVCVVPLSDSTLINGLRVSYLVKGPERTESDTPCVKGPIGFEVVAKDRINSSLYWTVPYRVELYVDATPLAVVHYDSVNFHDYVRVYSLYRRCGDFFSDAWIKLYPTPSVPGYVISFPDFRSVFTPGLHDVRIIATDKGGNTSEFKFCFRVSPKLSRSQLMSIKNWDHIEKGLALKFSDYGCLIRLSTEDTLYLNDKRVRPVAVLDSFAFYYIAESGSGVIKGHHARKFSTARVEDGDFLLETDNYYVKGIDACAASHFFLWLSEVRSSLSHEGFRGTCKRFLQIFPRYLPLLKKLEVGVKSDTTVSQKLCILRRDKKGFRCVGVGGRSWVEEFGTFATLYDLDPPVLRFMRRKGRYVAACVEDNGSGVDPYSLVVEIDGRWVPADFDPETGELRYGPIDKKKHMVELRVCDKAGNYAIFRRILR